MKRLKLVLAASLLIGCHDFAFDCFGRPPSTQSPNKGTTYVGVSGEAVQCTNDDQCGAEFSCVKDADSFTGVCAQLIIISK